MAAFRGQQSADRGGHGLTRTREGFAAFTANRAVMELRRALRLASAGLLATGLLLTTQMAQAGTRAAPAARAQSAPSSTCTAPAPMTFDPPAYVDEHRAGGEPIVATHPDGTLLWGSHAGSTHFFAPAGASPTTGAFIENYTGQTYFYWSKDNGKTWTFVPRSAPPNNAPLTGFSDPDFAIDKAGQVFISEINLVNVAMSKSSDVGRSYSLQNFFSQVLTDRQWTEADEKDVVYAVGNASGGGTSPTDPVGHNGHILYKSKDGGQTFTAGVLDDKLGDGLGDLRVDKSDGTLYEAHYDSDGPDDKDNAGVLSIAAFRQARQDKLTDPDMGTVATGVSMLSHWPAFDIDPDGNLYITWDESGQGTSGRKAGVYYSYSTDRGKTWAAPLRVDTDEKTDIWPWLAVGDKGRVAIAWFEADKKLPNEDAQTSGDYGWNVYAAQTLNGLGCGGAAPAFTVAKATPEPFHTGTICMGGTVCQAQAIDRRLGDYFAIEIDGTGRMYAAYSDTRKGGAISLPSFLRQSGGRSFLAATDTAAAAPAAAPAGGGTLPATGGGSRLGLGLSALGVVALIATRRRRRAPASL